MRELSTLSDIQIGYTARGRLEPMEGGVRVIQLRDTFPEGGLKTSLSTHYRIVADKSDSIPERYWVTVDDVVFRSRGERNTATVLGSEFTEPAVAVMPLVILRAKHDVILPGYLAWFLNQPEAQRHFDGCARGTGMRMIPMGCLAALKVPLPDLGTQNKIAAVADLARHEFELATRLAEKRRQLLTAALLNHARQSVEEYTGATPSKAMRPRKEGAK